MDTYAKLKELIERVERLEAAEADPQLQVDALKERIAKLERDVEIEGQISDALRGRIEKLEAANAVSEERLEDVAEVLLGEPIAAHGASEIVDEEG